MASRGGIFIATLLIGGIWTGGFLIAGQAFAPPPYPPISASAKNILEHFSALAAQQRKQLDLEPYFQDRHEPGRVTAIVEFTTQDPIPVRTLAIDGFLTRYVEIARGEDGVTRVFASYSRPEPYIWPRTLDLSTGPGTFLQAELQEDLSGTQTATYHAPSVHIFDMRSPNGHFKWTTEKDNNALNSSNCLYRQDLFKNGEYVKSLIAQRT